MVAVAGRTWRGSGSDVSRKRVVTPAYSALLGSWASWESRLDSSSTDALAGAPLAPATAASAVAAASSPISMPTSSTSPAALGAHAGVGSAGAADGANRGVLVRGSRAAEAGLCSVAVGGAWAERAHLHRASSKLRKSDDKKNSLRMQSESVLPYCCSKLAWIARSCAAPLAPKMRTKGLASVPRPSAAL